MTTLPKMSEEKLSEQEKEIIVSIDIEADRPCQGVHDKNGCLCVALVALRKLGPKENVLDKEVRERLIISSLILYPETSGDPDEDTYNWWQSEEDGRKEMYRDFKLKHKLIKDEVDRLAVWYFDLVDRFKKVTFVAKPAAYDWQWLNWLWCSHRQKTEEVKGITREWPHKCVCVSSIENLAKGEWKSLNEELNKLYPRKHDAYEDALRQGLAYLHIERETINLIRTGIEVKNAIKTSEHQVGVVNIKEMVHNYLRDEHMLVPRKMQ